MEYKELLKNLRALKVTDEGMAEDIINVFAEIIPKASIYFRKMKSTVNNRDDKIASLERKIANFENKTVEPIVVEKVRAERSPNKKATDQSLRIAQMKEAAKAEAEPTVEVEEPTVEVEAELTAEVKAKAVKAEAEVETTPKATAKNKKVSNEVEI